MRLARSLSELTRYLGETIEGARFQRSRVTFDGQDEWAIRDGVLSHRSNSFFHVVGYQNGGREHLLLYQPQNALNGIALHRDGRQTCLLLQARVEPGNTGIGNFGPTVQSTAGNYMRQHGGRATTHLDLFFTYHPDCQPISNSTQFDLGDYYLHKTKTISAIETSGLLDTEQNMVWVEAPVLIQALHTSHLINTDLRSLLVTLDWDALLAPSDVPAQPSLTGSPAMLDKLALPPAAPRERGRMVPLDQLTDWAVTDDGIADRAGRGRSVQLVRVETGTREVPVWTQPLVCAANRQHVVLLVRNWQSDAPEFLITAGREIGVSGGQVLQPSAIHTSGPVPDLQPAGSRIIHDCTQSEEGGRFMELETRYQIVEVDSTHAAGPDQYWVDAALLKRLLRTSNRTSMLLRCVASLVLPKLYPALASEMEAVR